MESYTNRTVVTDKSISITTEGGFMVGDERIPTDREMEKTMNHKEIIAAAQAELAPTNEGKVPTPAPQPQQQQQQLKIEDLTDEQLLQAVSETHAEVGLLCLTERALTQQLNTLRSKMEQLEARNAALYNLAQKRNIQQLPVVQFGPA